MLDVKYYKDYSHNYLILKDNGCLSENVYQRKMITENKIKGLLESQERHINGDILLYYEITSRQSLFSIYEGKTIGMEELGKFFLQLKLVNDMLQKYLLDGNCLVLSPEYIFRNLETQEYYFLYYPDPDEGDFTELLDFFLSRVNNEDPKAVEAVYKIADLVAREQFVLDEILKWFQDDVVEGEKSKNRETPTYKGDNQDILAYQGENREETGQAFAPGNFGGQEKKYGKVEWKKIIPLWAAGFLGGAVLIYIMYTFQLSYQEEMYLMIGWIVVAALAAGPGAWILYLSYMNGKEEGQVQLKGEKAYPYVATGEKEDIASRQDLGNTVFIPWTESCENKLYSMDKKNKCHIDLEKLPVTVGKLAGAVDMVINEKSISRMHVKFSKNGNNICITDLNSTNGTFRNGMRLSPNASEVIEPGDEIRLGKLKFIYR
ncbi:oxoglutarate dehydrogenase inhibitor [Lachnospiraceae bacterium]|nr:oxoglutarate dehydrogenase inhibitor [Lachnospiraceae bacterium]